MFTFERVIGTWHHFLKMYKQMPTFDTLGLTLFIQILTILSILRQPLQYSGIFPLKFTPSYTLLNAHAHLEL